MVDSCFKLFRSKCYRKNSVLDSRESIYENEKCAIGADDKKVDYNFDCTATSIDNDMKRGQTDSGFGESEHQFMEVEPDVILRRFPRHYLRSVSTSTSYDAMTSDDDWDDENLDILYPLPRVNTHERSLSEESNRQTTVDKANGTRVLFHRVFDSLFFCK